MKVIYIAGPLSTGCFSPTNPGVFNAYRWEHNVRNAEQLMVELTLEGFACICVHAAARFCFGQIPEKLALEADFELVRRSDAIAVTEGWNRSNGTLQEIALAEKLGKPIAGRDCSYTGAARGRAIAVELRDLFVARKLVCTCPSNEYDSPCVVHGVVGHGFRPDEFGLITEDDT